MARRKPRLVVIVSPRAANDLRAIYRYNAEQRGGTAAKRYEAFLREKLGTLAAEYEAGRIVEVRPDLRFLLMKKRSGGDGHIAVYSIDHDRAAVDILFVFHTKQDWQNKL